MSTYRSAETVFDTNVAGIYDNATGQYDALMNGMCSADVARLAREAASLTVASTTSETVLWAKVDSALPAWQRHLPAASVADLTAARSGAVPIGTALASVAQSLASLERLAVADTSVTVLTGLGYTIRRADGVHTSAVEARREHETFLVVVGDQGKVTTDHVDVVGDQCNDRQHDFVEGMRERGVLFDETVNVQHHDPRGGTPTQRASHAGRGNLAEGAVLDGDDQPSSFMASLLPQPAPSASRQLQGGAR